MCYSVRMRANYSYKLDREGIKNNKLKQNIFN